MALSLGEILFKAGVDLKDFEKGTAQIQKGLTGIGTLAGGAGKALTAGLTLPLVGLGLAAVKFASDFESTFAGVKKTVDETVNTSFADLEQGFKDLSLQIPIAVEELNKVGEAAGQLGVGADDILEFTEIMALLGVTTNLAADEAATGLARFANITGGLANTDIPKLADVIVELGNNFATTESEILQLATRLAAASDVVGFSQENIFALAAVLKDVGVQAEAGGSAISKTFRQIETAVVLGTDDLAKFAEIAGQSTEGFAKAFREDGQAAVLDFIQGLGQLKSEGESVTVALAGLGITMVRQVDTLDRLAGSAGKLEDALQLVGEGGDAAGALAEEAAKRFETFESQLLLVQNQAKLVLATLGKPLLDILKNVLDALRPVIEFFGELATKFAELDPRTQTVIVGIAGIAAAIGPALLIFSSLVGAFSTLVTVLPLVATATAAVGGAFTAVTAAASSLLGVLLPVAAALAGGIVVGTAIRDLTGLGDVLDNLALKFLNVKTSADGLAEQSFISEQQITAIERAEELTGQVFTRTVEGVDMANAALADYNAALREQNTVTKEVVDTNDDAAGSVTDLGDATTLTKDELEKLTGVMQGLTTIGLEADMEELNAALALIHPNATLTEAGLKRILDTISLLNKEGVELTGRLAEISDQFRIFGTEALETLPPIIIATEDWDKALMATAADFDQFDPAFEGLKTDTEILGGLETKTFDWGAAMTETNDILSETRGVMNLLGIDADSTFGKIIGGISSVFDSLNGLLGLFGKFSNVLGSLFGGGGKGGGLGGLLAGLGGGGGGGAGLLASGAGAIGGLFAAPTAAVTLGAGIAGPVAPAAAGGALSGLGASLAPLFTNPFTIAIGAGLASFFVLKNIFGGKANVGETIGRELGEEVAGGLSQSLTDSLTNLAEQTGSLDIATQLGLGAIFQEALANGTANLDLFAEQIADTFSFLERGEISAAQAAIILEENIALILPRLDELGPAGEEQIQRLIGAAQAMGVEFEGLDGLITQFGGSVTLSGDEALAAFEAMGGSIATFTARIQSGAADAGRALERLARIQSRIARGAELGPIQQRFLERSGLPAMQEGGIVTSPTVALIGEGGPEAVIPLDLPELGASGGSGRGMGGGGTDQRPIIVVKAMIDSKVLFEVVEDGTRTGQLRTHRRSVQEFGS